MVIFHSYVKLPEGSSAPRRAVAPPPEAPGVTIPVASKRSAEATGVTIREAAREEVINPRFRARSWLAKSTIFYHGIGENDDFWKFLKSVFFPEYIYI